jgi:thymidine kinase
VSAPYASEEKHEAIRELAVDEIEVECTGLGYRFATEDFDTMGYWQ